MKKTAFVFDMNGTMIDDMAYHTKVWHHLLTEDLGSKLTYEEVKLNMYGKNGDVFDRIFGKNKFTEEEVNHWSIEKEKRYQKVYFPHLELIDGLDLFLEKAKKNNIQMGIGSAAIPFNINFVLDNLNLHSYFNTVVSADDVSISKPHPETFLKAAKNLHSHPEQCVVFEDAPKGVEAAQNAGMECVVILSAHGPEDFKKYNNVIAMVKDYKDKVLEKLF